MPAFNLGQGVVIRDVAGNKLSEEDRKAKAEAIAKVMSKGKWGPKPIVQAQYAKYPTTVRKEAKQVAVFNLMLPKQVEEFNALLAKTQPLDSPEIILIEQDKHFSDAHNTLTYVVMYYPISYLQLDTKGFQLLANVD